MPRVTATPICVPVSEAQMVAVVDAVTQLWALPHHDDSLGRSSDDLVALACSRDTADRVGPPSDHAEHLSCAASGRRS
jgi:hypothetical protein